MCTAIFSSTEEMTRYPLEDWKAFKEEHLGWLAKIRRPDGVVFSLPPAHINDALDLYQLDAESELAEREFAALCNRHYAIGAVDERLIDYPWLRPLLPMPQVDLQEFLDLGWTQEDIDNVGKLKEPTRGLHERMKALLGRLISTPKFIVETDDVYSAWLRLPDEVRPPLPHYRSVRRSKLPTAIHCPDAVNIALKEFCAMFDYFCDGWQIAGMATWRLPIPRGPILTPGVRAIAGHAHGELSCQVPLHFPLLAEDGVGPLILEEHRRQAVQFGIDDHGSWQSYATMFEIYHWEYVVRERYGREFQKKAFVTDIEFILRDLLDVSQERVRRLRTTLSAKLRGKTTSLQGQR